MLETNINSNYGFIYLTTNMVNNKKYIGQKRYLPGWETYLGSGKILNQAIKKYGKDNFHRKILYIARSKDELDFLEKLIISSRNAVKNNNYYNVHVGGNGGNTIAGFTDEQKKIFSDKIKNSRPDIRGQNNPNYGNVWSEEKKKELSIKKKESYIKENHPMLGRTKEKSPLYGRKHSENTKQKMKEKAKKKTVVKTEFESFVFDCREDARNFIGTTIRTLNNHLNKGTKIKGKFEVYDL